MSARGRITFLGTGTSHGVPMIGCTCAVCRSTDPRDRRLRTSVYVEVPDHARLLIDTSTDLRQQALTFGVMRVDGVLFTHGHADHVMGLDELRRFNAIQGGAIPAYADARTWEGLRRTFHYAFDEHERQGGGVPRVEAIEVSGPFVVGGVRVTPVPVWHGNEAILGYRLGKFAYLTDCSGLPDESWSLLDGVGTLVVDALRHRRHPTHFSVSEALEAIGRIGPRHAYLTHISHDLAHQATSRDLPDGVELAYDGLVLDVDVETA